MSNTADRLFSEIPTVGDVRANLIERTRGDKYIWGLVILLAMISVLVVYSATGSLAYKMNNGNNELYLFKQLAFMLLGMLIIYFMHRVNYTIYSKVA